jgi:hypothetical protein
MILEHVWGPGYSTELHYLKVYAYPRPFQDRSRAGAGRSRCSGVRLCRDLVSARRT